MKIEMTGTDEWEFAISGMDRRTLVMLASAVKRHRDKGNLTMPEDWGLLDTMHTAILDALYPDDALVTFAAEYGKGQS